MMAWAEVSFSVPAERVPALESALSALGAMAVTLLDPQDRAVLEPAPGATPLWPVVRVCALFPAAIPRDAVSLGLRHVAGLDLPDDLAWREVPDQLWERAWMDRFQPMRFGKKLWVVPSGMDLPADPRANVLRLDPGLAFGTGTHPTTALCLEWIDGHEFDGRRVVDYGCGSGILGIACAVKGASSVVCVDNDPQALEATTKNAARNAVSHCIVCGMPETYREKGADILLANILSGPLIGLAPRLMGSLRHGGHIVLSGILEAQAEEVIQAYRAGCGKMDIQLQEGWVRLHGIAG